jgi:hypothetical protein
MASEIVAYEEIVGEQNRGGQMVGADQAYEILGDMMAKSPAFSAYVQKRIASTRPVLRKVAPTKWRDWQVDFGPVTASSGSTTTIEKNPQVLFEGQRVMATDEGYNGGTNIGVSGFSTRIAQIFVGQESQRPANQGSTLTNFFANVAIGSGIKWDTCQIGNTMSVTVLFGNDATFDMTVFGRAVK